MRHPTEESVMRYSAFLMAALLSTALITPAWS